MVIDSDMVLKTEALQELIGHRQGCEEVLTVALHHTTIDPLLHRRLVMGRTGEMAQTTTEVKAMTVLDTICPHHQVKVDIPFRTHLATDPAAIVGTVDIGVHLWVTNIFQVTAREDQDLARIDAHEIQMTVLGMPVAIREIRVTLGTDTAMIVQTAVGVTETETEIRGILGGIDAMEEHVLGVQIAEIGIVSATEMTFTDDRGGHVMSTSPWYRLFQDKAQNGMTLDGWDWFIQHACGVSAMVRTTGNTDIFRCTAHGVWWWTVCTFSIYMAHYRPGCVRYTVGLLFFSASDACCVLHISDLDLLSSIY